MRTSRYSKVMKLETVLVPVGSDDKNNLPDLLSPVIGVAGPANAKVIVYFMLDQEEYNELEEKMGIKDEGILPEDLAVRDEMIDEIGDLLESNDISYEIEAEIGEESEHVLNILEQREVDLVIIGGKPQSPARKAFFGNFAQNILINASCPTTYVTYE